MIKKIDDKSRKIHDAAYQSEFNLENSIKRIEEYNTIDLYGNNGFKEVVELAKESIQTHIDIGCGTGWLMIKTAPFFKTIVGIDPSDTAISIAKEITKDIPNIEFINGDMVDSFLSLKLSEPALITTGVVFSHIEDYHVKAFLEKLNNIPNGSMIYFDEPYGTNIQQSMWHVRSKKWWGDNLPEWDLTFKVRKDNDHSGVFGKKVGKENRTNTYPMTMLEHFYWFTEGIEHKIMRLYRAFKRLVLKKKV